MLVPPSAVTTHGSPHASAIRRARRTPPIGPNDSALAEKTVELAALLGGDAQSVEVLQRLAAQHNQQRSAQSVADERYEIRWQAQTPATATADAGSTWLLVGDADALAPLAEVLATRGAEHRLIGLPATDEDEQALEAQLQAAAESAVLRIVLAAPAAESLSRMQHHVLVGARRLFRASAAAGLRALVDEAVEEPIRWQAENAAGEAVTREARLPRVIFTRTTAALHEDVKRIAAELNLSVSLLAEEWFSRLVKLHNPNKPRAMPASLTTPR